MADDSEALLEAIVGMLSPLLQALQALEFAARNLHPPRLRELVDAIADRDVELREGLAAFRAADWPEHLADFRDQVEGAADAVIQAFDGLRAAPDDPNAAIAAYRALRHYARAAETLYPLARLFRPVSQFFLENAARHDEDKIDRLAADARPGIRTGVLHGNNDPGQRGGFSVYVPEDYDGMRPVPLVMALHGGSGHGRGFLWTWLREARTRGPILVSPTATGSTWSLMEPEVDSQHLERVLGLVRERWNVDTSRLLLTGMSDGGTFAYVSGLQSSSPFTHLAPISASFHPMLLSFMDPVRLIGLPIHIVHGALDWMFPAEMARGAEAALKAAGAEVTYREVADLSHTYPREMNAAILDWFLRRD
ncbi:phospholipase [Desertibaculum subflavum]|uniref:phospholipase n=1 Tax=Desertibaculum subflavum TaxID=2268458 RepID=UPI000E67143D